MMDPLFALEWRDATSLHVNDYNPNVVHKPELRLLEHSLLTTGWVQPVLISREGVIIDGFHRTFLTLTSKAVAERWGGESAVCRA